VKTIIVTKPEGDSSKCVQINVAGTNENGSAFEDKQLIEFGYPTEVSDEIYDALKSSDYEVKEVISENETVKAEAEGVVIHEAEPKLTGIEANSPGVPAEGVASDNSPGGEDPGATVEYTGDPKA
jgi:hypothetical protein